MGPTFADTSAAVFDLSVKFEGQTKAEFVMTTAWASSLINGSRSVLVFLKSHPAQHPHLPRQKQVTWTKKSNMLETTDNMEQNKKSVLGHGEISWQYLCEYI